MERCAVGGSVLASKEIGSNIVQQETNQNEQPLLGKFGPWMLPGRGLLTTTSHDIGQLKPIEGR